MDALVQQLSKFISRDIIYISCGCIVLTAILLAFPTFRHDLSRLLSSNEKMVILFYAAALPFAYAVSYLLHELFSIIGITINHEWWYPKHHCSGPPWATGRLVSFIHKRIHGVPLLPFERPHNLADFSDLVEPGQRAHQTVNSLSELSQHGENGQHLRLALYPYYVEHFDKTENEFWISRLIWLRFFGGVCGSCLLTSSIIIFVGILCSGHLNDFTAWIIGGVLFFAGLFLAVHAYYRSAQIMLARLIILNRPPNHFRH